MEGLSHYIAALKSSWSYTCWSSWSYTCWSSESLLEYPSH